MPDKLPFGLQPPTTVLTSSPGRIQRMGRYFAVLCCGLWLSVCASCQPPAPPAAALQAPQEKPVGEATAAPERGGQLAPLGQAIQVFFQVPKALAAGGRNALTAVPSSHGNETTPDQTATEQAASDQASLPEGFERLTARRVDWQEGLTVAAATQACLGQTTTSGETLAPEPGSPTAMIAQGEGESFFVHSLLGLENGSIAGHFWTFRVNGKLGNLGAGVTKLRSGDQITWRLGPYEE